MGSPEATVHSAVQNARGGRPLAAPRGPEYVSRFERWEAEASVRANDRRLIQDLDREEAEGRRFFPLGSAPVTGHPVVRALGQEAQRSLLLRSLYAYLDFTSELEQTVVNPITQQISRRRLGVQLPPQMEEDAYKIYADEAWHALFSDDLQRQVERATRVTSVLLPCPLFAQRLAALERDLDTAERYLARIFFAIVSETLISSFLADVPKDTTVIEPIRALVRDHAIDEGRHHAYFSQLLGWVWPAMSSRQRRAIGGLLPEFIRAFLEPDLAAIAAMLLESGLDESEVEVVLLDVHGDGRIDGVELEKRAHHTLRHLRRVGVFNDPRTRAGFLEAGIAVPA
jgi:hypothetical protein